MELNRFHLSLPCMDATATRKFYRKELGFTIGRKSYRWFDVNIFGNQITFTEDDGANVSGAKYEFDTAMLPTFHFGIILDDETWLSQYNKFKDKDYFTIGVTKFLSEKIGAHKSFFVIDNNGYFLEFKNFYDHEEIFEWDES